MLIAFLFSLALGSVNATEKSDHKVLIGKWKYEVPAAPYGYEKGNLEFTEKDGTLTGNVIFQDGYKVELKKITFEDNVLSCGLYIDYEYISVKAKINEKKLTGNVNGPEGEMKLTAEKAK